MKIVFCLLFLFHVSFCRNSSNPKSSREIAQYRFNSTGNVDSGTCLPPASSGSVNWWGVASAIGSMLPGIGSTIGGLLGIMANLGISSGESDDYGAEFNKCIEGMIRRQLTASQLADAKKYFEQIGGELDDFLDDIVGPIDENILSQNILPAINNMKLKVDALEVLFDSDDDEFNSFKFIELLLDGLAVESISRLAFLARLEELNYNNKDFCRHIEDMQDDFVGRYEHFFESNYLHNELYEGSYGQWTAKIRKEEHGCKYYQQQCYDTEGGIIHDDYTLNTTWKCISDCNPHVQEPHCTTGGCRSQTQGHYDEALRFVRETMANVDKYLSNAEKIHQLTLKLVGDLYEEHCTTPPTTSPPARDCAWERGDSCYNYDMKEVSWPDAEDFCKDNYNGHLVAPSTENEMMFLEDKLHELVENEPDLRKRFWIGANLDHKEHWFWSNGESWDWDYHAPDGEEGGRDRLYLMGEDDGKGSWKWHSNEYSEQYPIMCESK